MQQALLLGGPADGTRVDDAKHGERYGVLHYGVVYGYDWHDKGTLVPDGSVYLHEPSLDAELAELLAPPAPTVQLAPPPQKVVWE